jgi:hypothetical protein
VIGVGGLLAGDGGTLPRVIPWIIIAVVAVPLVVVAFMAMRRNTAASEPADDSDARVRAEQDFAEAEAYEAKWHEEDKERYHQERQGQTRMVPWVRCAGKAGNARAVQTSVQTSKWQIRAAR